MSYLYLTLYHMFKEEKKRKNIAFLFHLYYVIIPDVLSHQKHDFF